MKNILFISLLALLVSCQPSKITQTWTSENTSPKKYKKVLVLGVMPETEDELRVKMENHLADDLRGMGYLALAANKIYPAGTFIKGDTARAVAALEGKGFDGILTIVLVDKKKQPYYVPGKMTDYTQFQKMGAFYRYYNTVAENIYSPGYYGEETKYVWENNFYDLTSQHMIYSARSRSFDFTSKNSLAHSYGMLLVQNLVKKNILQKPDPKEE